VSMDPSEPRDEGAPPSEPMGTPPPPQEQMPPPPQQSWQSQPQQPAPPPPPGGGMTTPAVPLPPGPIAGTTIADFITRLVAFIIDGIVIGIAGYIVQLIVYGILPFPIDLIVHAAAVLAISAGYFIYFWTTRRQTPGMIVMKLLVVEDGTGATLTQPQAIRRWIFLGLPLALSTLLQVSGGIGIGIVGLGGLGFLLTLVLIVALISLVYEFYLAYTTYQDPRKQGFHDKQVNTVVVSYGPSPFNQSAR
jgi:uncharacterized RDD family membrane protein YckC